MSWIKKNLKAIKDDNALGPITRKKEIMKTSYTILEHNAGDSKVLYEGIETLIDAVDIIVSLRRGTDYTYTLHAKLNV